MISQKNRETETVVNINKTSEIRTDYLVEQIIYSWYDDI